MSRNFDRPTASGRTVADSIFAPLDRAGLHPVVVDAGARNGMFELPASYAGRADFIGFEPNREEYEKLVGGTTDAIRCGLAGPRFRSTAYHQTALWSSEERRRFYITAGAGACTLMGAASARMTGNMFRDNDKGAPYGSRHTDVRTTDEVPCRPLDSLIETTVDYLKIDVEGAELDVLTGARALFEQRKVLFVKTEFVFTPYYERHPVLGHQHVFLDGMGLRLLDLDSNHARYARGRTRIPARADRRLIYAGDAFFCLDPDRVTLSPLDLQRLAVIVLVFGFHSLGISLLRDAGLLPAAEIDAIETTLAYLPARARLRDWWHRVPEQAATVYWKLRRAVLSATG